MRRPALPAIVLLVCLVVLAFLVARVAHWSPVDVAREDAKLAAAPMERAGGTEHDVASETAPLEVPREDEPAERAHAGPIADAPVLAAPDDEHALITGVVRERGSGRPVPGATVVVSDFGSNAQGVVRMKVDGVPVTIVDHTTVQKGQPAGTRGTPPPSTTIQKGLPPPFSRTLTGPDGRFQFVVERAGHAYDVVASAAGFAPGGQELDDLSSGRAEVVLELDANRSAHGRVLDRAGRPVVNAQVVLECLNRAQPDPFFPDVEDTGWSADGKFGATDADGRFRFVDLDARAKLRLLVRSVEHGVAVREEPTFTALSNDVDFGDVVLREPFELRGTVVRLWKGEAPASAEPFGGVVVELQADGVGSFIPRSHAEVVELTHRVRTGSDGSFAFDGLLPGRYRVAAFADAFGDALEVELDARGVGSSDTATRGASSSGAPSRGAPSNGSPSNPANRGPSTTVYLGAAEVAPVRLVVARTTTLRGVVLDPELRPAAHAYVEAVARSAVSSATSDGDGRFELSGVGRGALLLRARPGQGTEGVLPETTLEGVLPGAGDVRIVLAAATFVAGRVLDGDGKPVAFAGVTARSSVGKELDFVYTDDAGAFRLRVPKDEAVELEACPSRVKEGGVRTLDGQNPLRGRARGVRASGAIVELALVEAR